MIFVLIVFIYLMKIVVSFLKKNWLDLLWKLKIMSKAWITKFRLESFSKFNIYDLDVYLDIDTSIVLKNFKLTEFEIKK